MAGSNAGPIIILGGVAVGAWYVYKNYFATPAVSATGTAASPETGTTGATAPASTVAPSVLDTYYSQMVANATAADQPGPLTPDQWGYYLNQYLNSVGSSVAPDPLAVWTQAGFDRTVTMTAPVYWASVAPYLRATRGLSGLGIYGGLGQIARAVR